MLRVLGAMKEGKPYFTDEQLKHHIEEMERLDLDNFMVGSYNYNASPEFKKLFAKCDIGSKGHLTKDEFIAYLMAKHNVSGQSKVWHTCSLDFHSP